MKTQLRRLLTQAICILSCGFFLLWPVMIVGQENRARPVAPRTQGETAVISRRPQLFDLSAIDQTINPCEDFYEYACGTWRRNNPIPSDQVFWARYNQLAEYNREVLHKILEQAAGIRSGRTEAARIAGEFYASCMDESRTEQKGYTPIQPELDRVAVISSHKQLMEVLAQLHSIGVQSLFEFRAQPDLHNAMAETATVVQGNLGLPDRDYYINQDERAQQTRARYLTHMTTMFKLAGESASDAERETKTVLAIETGLAEASFDRVKMRDPKNRDHKMELSELTRLVPNLLLQDYFRAAGVGAFDVINVAPPDFFQKLNTMMGTVPLDDWRTYLKWRLIQADAPLLSNAFVREDFEFERRYLNGQRELEPRWKRCVSATDRLLGEALGRVYVEQTFPPAGKERIMAMVTLEEQSLAEDIQDLSWMTTATRQQAVSKLKAINHKIGYPEKWLDYGAVKIKRDDLPGNVSRIHRFDVKRNLGKIGKPTDRKQWIVTTPTVNAYYYAPENSINFPAGVLQPPLFDPNMDDAVNFGAIGWLIGHELTHGFDDQGSKFDGQGNLSNWWTQDDLKEFAGRTSCIADQYQQFVVVDDIHLNGRLTLGENTADNGGIRIAFAALHKKMANADSGLNTIDGFSPEQRFFISFAQQWCANVTPERLRVISKVDPHAPTRLRTLGTLRNYSEFAKAFGCKAGQAMVSANSCRVW